MSSFLIIQVQCSFYHQGEGVKYVKMMELKLLCHDGYRYTRKTSEEEILRTGRNAQIFQQNLSLSLSPRWTQWSVKTSMSVHILPILGLLLLAQAAGVIAQHFFPLCRAEAAEAHHGLHGGEAVVVVALALDLYVLVVLVLVHLARRRRCVFPF